MWRRVPPPTPAYLYHLPPITSSTSSAPATSALLRFYGLPHGGHDHRGRTLTTILSFPDWKLEELHDWIQWLFPLPETSPFNVAAPVLTSGDVAAFRSCAVLRDALRRSFSRMLEFYGFETTGNGGGNEILSVYGCDRKRRNWWRSFDHNHLRITRIIRSLRVLGLAREAARIWNALVAARADQGAPGDTSYKFWRRAATRKIWIAPEEEDEEEEEEEEEGEESDAETLPDDEMTDVDEEWVGIQSGEDDTEKGEDGIDEEKEKEQVET